MSDDCLFCKIARGEMGELLHHDEHVSAFRDINPQADTHILIIPNKHITSINHVEDDDIDVMGRLLLTAKKLAAAEGIAEDGYRLAVNTGPHGQQTVMHIHVHLLGGRQFSWPPG